MILGTMIQEKDMFQKQINVDISRAWGIMKMIISAIAEVKEEQCSMVLMKDPNKAMVRNFKSSGFASTFKIRTLQRYI